jgi:myo-inositol catabolism protein IolC
MEETTELSEKREKRKKELEVKARQREEAKSKLEEKWEADRRSLLEDIVKSHPEQFAEFSRLKKLRDEPVEQNIDDKLYWLLMDMLFGREWNYHKGDSSLFEWLPDYLDDEKAIIHDIAGKYYESLEKRLWMGKKVKISEAKLISLIEEAGIVTFERRENLLKATTSLLSDRSRLYDHIYGVPGWVHEHLADLPEELQL